MMPWLTSFHITTFGWLFDEAGSIFQQTFSALWSADGHGDFFRVFLVLILCWTAIRLFRVVVRTAKK